MVSQKPKGAVTATKAPVESSKPVNPYGGNSRYGFLSILPDSWLPYVQLTRLSPPAGLFLIYFPHLIGLLHAAILQHSPLEQVFSVALKVLGGSFFVSNAIHIWNDLIDAPVDAKIERTSKRPIPRGAVSPFAAVVFTVTQAIGAVIFLNYLPFDFQYNLCYALPSIIAWTYYPWAKLHTHFPQIVLGFALGWGTLMGSLAMGMSPFTAHEMDNSVKVKVTYSTLCLSLVCLLWTAINDCVYAFQDRENDIRIGVKSMAVLYGDTYKPMLSYLLAATAACLVACGILSNIGPFFYAVSACGAVTSLGAMIAQVDLQDSQNCWWWFSNGFWYTGGLMTSGLVLEYLYQKV